MKRFSALLFLVLLLTTALFGQENFRNPRVSALEPDGALVLHAVSGDDPLQSVVTLEEFFGKYGESQYRPYALYSMLIAANNAKQPEKALTAGLELLELAPEDLEVRHRVNQALVGSARWDELRASIDLTKPLAEAETASPSADAAAYASGVLDWLSWASNMALLGETDPAKKITWLDRISTDYPESQYTQNIAAQYVQVYQQAGDTANMAVWMQKAVDGGIEDESYRYSLAENAIAKQDNNAAQKHAEKALEIIEAKTMPPGMAEEQWAVYKTRMTAYANFALGRAWAGRDTKDAYRTGRTHLLKTVDVIKAEGGDRYNVLAYYLGVCYVQLDIRGDNIRRALEWMTEAANNPGPFQEQAKTALVNIRAAI